MGAEAILLMLAKVAAGLGAILIAALGWSIRKILDNLSRQLTDIQAMTLANKEQLATGAQTFRDLTRRIERLEEHDEDRCKTCRWEAAQFSPSMTPIPGRGG